MAVSKPLVTQSGNAKPLPDADGLGVPNYVEHSGVAAPAASGAGKFRSYYNTTLKRLLASADTGAYAPFGAPRVLVYQEGGTAGGDVYTSLSALAAVAVILAVKDVFIDVRFASGNMATPPSGAYDFGPNWALVGDPEFADALLGLTLTTGVTFVTRPIYVKDCYVLSTSSAAIFTSSSSYTMHLEGSTNFESSTSALFKASGTADLTITMDRSPTLSAGTGRIFETVNGSIFVYGFNQSSVAGSTLRCTGAGSITLYPDASSGPSFSASQSPTAIINPIDADGFISYDNSGALPALDGNPGTVQDAIDQLKDRVIPVYAQGASTTVANTTTETEFNTSPAGSKTTPDTYFDVGVGVRFNLSGIISSTGVNPTLRIRVYKGSTVLADSGAQIVGTGLSGRTWTLDFDVMGRSTTSTMTRPVFRYGLLVVGGENALELSSVSQPVTIGTSAEALSVTAQWGAAAAGNTITCDNYGISTIPIPKIF